MHDIMLNVGPQIGTDDPALRPISVLDIIGDVARGWVLLRPGDEVYAGTGALPTGAAPPMVYVEGVLSGLDIGQWRQRPGYM